MFKIVKKQPLNPTVTKMVVEAPLIAEKAHAGQFIILRVDARRRTDSADQSRAMTARRARVRYHFPDRRCEQPIELNAAERRRIHCTIS